jgi:hypothetical protein
VSSPSSNIYIYLPALKKKKQGTTTTVILVSQNQQPMVYPNQQSKEGLPKPTIYYGITCRSGNLTALLAMSWMKMEATISCAEVIWILGSACTKCANPCGSLVKCGGGRRDPLPPIFRSWHRLYLRRGGMQHVVFSLYSLFVTAYA